MDANFMNAKEMKYNVERKKITFTWKRDDEEEGKNYIHFTSLHPQSSSFHHPNTSTQPPTLLHLHDHSLAIFAFCCLFR
jgi:hypothetical protein